MILTLSPPPPPPTTSLHSATRYHKQRLVVAALPRDVDTFTDSSGYLFQLSTLEAESLTEYNISKISSIFRKKPLIVLRRVLQMGNTLGKWLVLRYFDSIFKRDEIMFKVN